MQYYIVELSKYAIAFLMVIYTLECFWILKRKEDNNRTGIFIRQGVEMFLIQFLAYLSMCLQTGQIEYLFFYAFLQIALFSTIVLYQMLYPAVNRLLVNNMCMLLSIGFIMLTRLDYAKAIKQFFIVVAGLILALIIPFLVEKLRILKHLKWIYGLAGVAALGIVLVLGQVTQGSKISYTIAGITLQPSELVKLIFAFFVAALLYKAKSFWQIMVSAVCAGIHVLILVASRDLGSSLIFFVGYLFVLLIATGNYLYFGAGILAGAGASVVAYYLFGHVRVRVQAFLDPFTVIDNEGYQMSQSLFAIGSGNWFGMGLYQGTPSDIPYVESDFMFSAIAEELGGIFAICLILVCLSCFFAFLKLSMRLQDNFYRLVGCCLAVMYIFQIFLTVGGGMKFIPLTGVTLPLVSYGGSSVLTTVMMFAIIQGLELIRYQEEPEDEDDEE
ncbi:MAG: FtsW/RodA/SpoVE family cell cycle protein [Lachnospiraceae bacterium]|nr:FtsW/RodA/SpoVE family cell cycle protein [Lachnospiraceae bacterium]